MLLADLVTTSRAVAATRSRTEKTALVADLLRRAAADGPETVTVAASYLAGTARQRRTGLGWRALADLPPPATPATLGLVEVDGLLAHLADLAGAGSQAARRAAAADLFGRATPEEQEFLRALLSGNLRQGALDAVLLDAVAQAAGVPLAAVRRAATFTPWSGEVAAAALSGGEAALAAFALAPGRPVRPMLASSAPTVAEAVEALVARDGGPVVVDRKLDGIRVQVHRTPQGVRVFTRSLDEVTERLPEVVEAARALPAGSAVLDGEAIALRDDGRPRPFQETGSRTASSKDVATLRAQVPLTVLFFDLLERDGADLMGLPASERLAALAALAPPHLVVPQLRTDRAEEAQEFFDATVAAGHEGVVVKSLAAAYVAGRRGADWVKVKPRHTLDLVVLAVEWGSGRRRGTLSNIHLGARDPATGEHVMLGKTFKGMTDEMLAWQTERFLALETHREGHVVFVRPEQVVEIAFDGVQRSTRYPGGVALRFARVLRYRDDKTAGEVDTVDAVRALL